jgi:hypothetical protein
VGDADPAPSGPAPSGPAVPGDAVEACTDGAYWSVSGCGWGADRVALPEEYAALLAPPIVVGVAVRAASTGSAPRLSAPPDRVMSPTPARIGRHRRR